MQITATNPLLTPARLINTRWVWTEHTGIVFSKSFYFGNDGSLKFYRTDHEHSWTLQDGKLRIFNDRAEVFWIFDVVIEVDDRLALIGRNARNPAWWFSLTEYRKEAKGAEEIAELSAEGADEGGGKQEGIRLVIWDLDETFWTGTLSEGGITPIQSNIEMIETLNQRGIVNAVCSKNNFEDAKQALVNLGIWDSFVFPEISFSPKGAMVKNIVKNAQLRPESILFIDDNKMNLNEALHYVPKLNVAEPDILPGLLEDPRFAGKPDLKKSRLARYKILEAKLSEKSAANGNNEEFLRKSDIRISFHTDIENEFARIHDLVNRTNQLNFTKKRWPEDIDAARAVFQAEVDRFGAFAQYIKVSDRFGNYGICGYVSGLHAGNEMTHFLFSCRAMNMGVEQFVWKQLGRPALRIVPPVVSEIDMDVDWIGVVDDADAAGQAAGTDDMQTVCIRGACDLMVTSQYLRTKVKTIEEFNYGYHGWEICSLPRIVALRNEIKTPANQEIIRRLPGMPVTRFDSGVIDGTADAYVLSFSQESFCGYFRSKSTGMILPLRHLGIHQWAHVDNKPDYTTMPFEEVEQALGAGTTRQQWDYIRSEFEFLGGFKPVMFINDVHDTLSLLKSYNKPVIILGLNDHIGRDTYILNFFKSVNEIVKAIVMEYGFPYIDITNFIHSENDLAKDGIFGGSHFARHVYAEIAEEILKHLPKAKAEAEKTLVMA
jgi:FkbH-like protein